MYNVEHPDITAMERTGYPTFMDDDYSHIYCDHCGRALEHDERYYHIRGENICLDCLDNYEEFAE